MKSPSAAFLTTLAHVGGADVPKDRAIDGGEQLDFFSGRRKPPSAKGFPRTSPTV
jgi:arylsulfatase